MERSRELLRLDDKEVALDVIKYEPGDIDRYRKAYNDWIKLNNNLREVGLKRTPIPQEFAEGLTAYIQGYWKIDDIYHRFDCYDPKGNKSKRRIEVKVSLGNSDISSFAPERNWDRLNFVSMEAKGVDNCIINIYDISVDLLKENLPNFDELFENKMHRRPRLSITKELIENKIYDNKTTFYLFD